MQSRDCKSGRIATIFHHNERSEAKRFANGARKMSVIRNYRNWRRYRETCHELNRLSNRELQDLGMSRGDIPFVARRSI